jgi:hypothetical protein
MVMSEMCEEQAVVHRGAGHESPQHGHDAQGGGVVQQTQAEPGGGGGALQGTGAHGGQRSLVHAAQEGGVLGLPLVQHVK